MNIRVGFRGGAWKPRTEYWNGDGERVFEGTREEGLLWLSEVGDKYDLPIFTECMSEQDLRHFGRMLDYDRDYLQVGARTSKAYPLLHAIGGTPFGVLIKSPEQGVNPRDAVGSLQRFEKNDDLIYCLRGSVITDPNGLTDENSPVMTTALQGEGQHPESRNFNNIGQIDLLRNDPDARGWFEENEVRLFYDPSHTFGGANDEVRRMIGEYAIKAITDPKLQYDGLIIEVNDRPDLAKCDGAQATLTTTNGVEWEQTNAGQYRSVRPNGGRNPNPEPYGLVDIFSELVDHQAERLDIDQSRAEEIKDQLYGLKWNNWAD